MTIIFNDRYDFLTLFICLLLQLHKVCQYSENLLIMNNYFDLFFDLF